MPKPPLPPEQRRTARIRVPVTADEKAAIERAAAEAGRPTARWLREIALKAATAEPDCCADF